MTKTRKTTDLEELLDALETLPAGERGAYLELVCPDPQVRREALAMLAGETTSTGYLDRFAGVVDRVAPKRPAPTDLTGKRIGAYRLLRPIGRGGMGLVYEAERADGAFEQRVALKMLTTALAGTEAHERFLAERRILAGLKHPAIAHIVDGGVTEDGTPWFAMERVEGGPIDAYCDRRRLGIRERLDLFLQVCDAVEHAHRRLVVHRDLKPANMLVTEGDVSEGPIKHAGQAPADGNDAPRGPPQVKLLDFGIARLLEPEGPEETESRTRTAARMMTPEYASPEQVRGEPVTTASDVYQLGLVLYELLTGHRPYTLRRRSASEIERVVCEQAPTHLNVAIFRDDTLKVAGSVSSRTRVAHAGAAPRTQDGAGPPYPTSAVADLPAAETAVDAVSRARRTSPERLCRRLRGDLDTIVLKALSKEPERRYGSADRLAEDIRRHLAGLPVTARADTWVYRGRKFLERHALGVGTAAVMLVLVAGLTGFHVMRIQNERDQAAIERDRAGQARNRAEAEAAKAEQVSEFLVSLFRSADPREARGSDIAARRKLLDQGAMRVDREFAAQPEVRANMLDVIGRTYLELGVYDSAERLLTRALELRRSRLGPDHPEVAESLEDLGLLLYRQGMYEQARDRLQEAAELLAASQGDDTPRLTEVLGILGETYRRLGAYEEGLATLKRALAIQIRASGEDAEPTAKMRNRLGAHFNVMGAHEAAEAQFERALPIHERELGPDHPLVGRTLMDLASSKKAQGKLTDAEALLRRSLAIQKKAYGPVHAEIGLVLTNLGVFLLGSKRYDESIEVLQRAVDIYTETVGPNHPSVAYPLVNLGEAHLAEGRPREARSYYQRSISIREQGLGERDSDLPLAYALTGLGRAETEIGNLPAAELALRRALATWPQALDLDDPRRATTFLSLGRVLAEQQQCAEAVPLLQRVVHIRSTRPEAEEPAAPRPDGEAERLLARCGAPSGP